MLILGVNFALVLADRATGPYLPFTSFYLLLMFFALRRLGPPMAYVVALISATGRTWVASGAFPSDMIVLAVIWQFMTSLSVYATVCYLLNAQFVDRMKAEDELRRLKGKAGESQPSIFRLPVRDKGNPAARKPARAGRKMWLALVSLSVISVLCSEQIFSKPAGRYRFDSETGKIAQTPMFAHRLSEDGVAKSKIVLLTFDDGPSNREVDFRILDILAKHAAPSLWFVNCDHFDNQALASAASNSATLLALAKRGHLIGSHAYHHVNLKQLAANHPEALHEEIEGCSAAIEKTTGARPLYFRAPWGEYAPEVVREAGRSGMQIMNWTSNTNDAFFRVRPTQLSGHLFDSADTDFANTVESGDVILLHDVPQTAEILDRLLTRLEKRGFRFVLPS